MPENVFIIESVTKFDEIFKAPSLPLFIPDLHFLRVILSQFILMQKKKLNTFEVPCQKSQTVSFVSSVMKIIV